MESEEFDTPTASWSEIASRRLRVRWVQVALTVACGVLVMTVSGILLMPKKPPPVIEPKFLFCPKCEYETRYDLKYDGGECTKCREEPVGKLEGRTESIKIVGKKSPWKWLYLALAIEGIATTGLVVFLLYRPASDPGNTFYVFSCPHCGQRLRFRHVSLGGLGQCKHCKRPVRFPTIDHAVLEDDLIREEQERLAAEHDNDDEE